jgi:rubredoxin
LLCLSSGTLFAGLVRQCVSFTGRQAGQQGLPTCVYNCKFLGGRKMDKWECPCGYVYDPEEGDMDNGIEPGTAWEDLPESWVCPLCGAEQEYFEKMD